MGVPLAEGPGTGPLRYSLPAGCGNVGVIRSLEGDAQARSDYTGEVQLVPIGGIPAQGGNPPQSVIVHGNVAQFSGSSAGTNVASGYEQGERQTLLCNFPLVDNGPGPPVHQVLRAADFNDPRWAKKNGVSCR